VISKFGNHGSNLDQSVNFFAGLEEKRFSFLSRLGIEPRIFGLQANNEDQVAKRPINFERLTLCLYKKVSTTSNNSVTTNLQGFEDYGLCSQNYRNRTKTLVKGEERFLFASYDWFRVGKIRLTRAVVRKIVSLLTASPLKARKLKFWLPPFFRPT
jgi:hypothetical protein